MPRFESFLLETYTVIIILWEIGELDDEDVGVAEEHILLAYEHYQLHHFPHLFNYEPGTQRFDLSSRAEWEVWELFRFDISDFPRLIASLRLPGPVIITPRSGYVFPVDEALLVLLWRLAHPNKWSYGVRIFRRSVSALSEIVHFLLGHIYEQFSHLLQLPIYFTDPVRVRRYADAVYAKSVCLGNCAFFLDGTRRSIAKPTQGQQAFFNGKDHKHCVEYLNVSAPNGIIVFQYGPEEGRHHDFYILGKSHLADLLEARIRYNMDDPHVAAVHTPADPECPHPVQEGPGGNHFLQYCALGDKGYHDTLNGAVIALFSSGDTGHPLSEEQSAFNKAMSKARVAIEWSFLETACYFSYVDHKRGMKIFETPVGHYYKVATILTNIHTILYGSRASSYFDVEYPSLEEYLSLPVPV